jgi:trehalose 6-phosphate synthase/phosphatase
MDSTERSARMEPMRERVRTNDIHNWVKTFLGDLKGSTENATRSVTHKFTPSAIESALQQVQSAEQLILFLDYDGTLLPLVKHPDLAIPSTELLSLLDRLAKRPATNVHIVSGRDKTTLEKWLGRLPLSLHAEHGLWSWNHSTRNWHRNIDVSDEWKQKVRPILEEFVKHLPGSFVEEKSAGIAWHYRQAEPDSGSLHAKELRLHLIEVLSNVPVEVITGDKVVEIRVQGINKGSIISRVLAEAQGAPLALAMGDDRTDEDLFSTLPPNGISIHVGPGPSRATYRLGDQSAVKGFLQAIL